MTEHWSCSRSPPRSVGAAHLAWQGLLNDIAAAFHLRGDGHGVTYPIDFESHRRVHTLPRAGSTPLRPDRMMRRRRALRFIASSVRGLLAPRTMSLGRSCLDTRATERSAAVRRHLRRDPPVSQGVAVGGHRRGGHARGARDPGGDGLHEDRRDAGDHGAVHDPDPDRGVRAVRLVAASRRRRRLRHGRDHVRGDRRPRHHRAAAEHAAVGRAREPERAARGGFLFLARIARLGFLANFLSRTVLVGFLTGVGIQVAIGQVGGMLGDPGAGRVPTALSAARCASSG